MTVRVLIIFVALLSCNGNELVSIPGIERNETMTIQSHEEIAGYELGLETNSDGKCALRYSRKRSNDENKSDTGLIVLDMQAPCEFVRMRNKKILSYKYGSGKKQYQALIIVGGRPDPEKNDELMPNGCGTEFIAVSLFETEIKVSERVDEGGAICPSKGLDEKYFGFFSKS